MHADISPPTAANTHLKGGFTALNGSGDADTLDAPTSTSRAHGEDGGRDFAITGHASVTSTRHSPRPHATPGAADAARLQRALAP